MLVACNKSETILASGLAFVRKRLEKDIDLLVTTRRKDISDTGADGGRQSVSVADAIPAGEAFTFELLASAPGGWQARWRKLSLACYFSLSFSQLRFGCRVHCRRRCPC